MSQKIEDFIPACENALQFYGGVPGAIVCDNLRSGVKRASRYEPTINETFADFAEHYNTAVLPARVYKPTDKAPVEIAVRISYTRIYSKVRDQKFNSLEALNKSIRLALDELSCFKSLNEVLYDTENNIPAQWCAYLHVLVSELLWEAVSVYIYIEWVIPIRCNKMHNPAIFFH